MMKRIKPEYRPTILFFISTLILMIFCLICRFCGIGYFANNYTVHVENYALQCTIEFFLKVIDMSVIMLILSKRKWYINCLLGFLYTCIYWAPIDAQTVFILDTVYILIIPFIVNRFDPETITYSLLLYIAIFLYQLLIMQARYTIDLTLKFNYIAGIVSVLDYKLFLINIYSIRRIINVEEEIKQQELPEAECNGFPGGHCVLLFGPEKLKSKAAIAGHIIGFPIFVIIYGIEFTAKLIARSCRKEN